ncbi:MAG: primosomal protein N', partial [bacterium]|nr:primosomal protein N' [bacterium]
KVADTLERGEQSVILINRRGFASVIWCPVCRWRLRCPHCNVGMVFHASRQRASCHHCRARIAVPERCPNVSCQTPVVQSGAGTQKIEQELTDSFPDARIARADSDTMKRGRDYQDMVDRFGSREIDILLGTQMIGKGLDFPHVSFVGMIAADLAGAASDFRASERLFQLITQVAGRAGRERSGGEVVVQTLVPEVLALQASVNHDYVGFAEHELATRRQLGMPPFTRLTRFVFADAREREARIAAERFADDLRNLIAELELEGTDLLGPQPCSIERLRGLYRYDLLLRATRTDAMQQIIDRYSEGSVSRPKVRSFVVDVDPLAMS